MIQYGVIMSHEKNNHRLNLAIIAAHAVKNRGLRAEISEQAMQQVESIREPKIDIKGNVRDQRHLLWCSIDNNDSMDLDQLTVSFTDNAQQVHILVAIADVDSLVKKNSAIDEQAQELATKLNFDLEKTKAILEAVLKITPQQQAALSEEDKKVLASVKEKEIALEQQEIFNEEWTDLEKGLRTQFPNATQEQLDKAEGRLLISKQPPVLAETGMFNLASSKRAR